VLAKISLVLTMLQQEPHSLTSPAPANFSICFDANR
jgi:hypothetical protein